MIYEIAVNFPQNNFLTYESEEALLIGTIVRIPLGRRQEWGVVWASKKERPPFKLKKILEVFSEICIREPERKLYDWCSKYYHYPLGQLIFDTLPIKKIGNLKTCFEIGAGADLPSLNKNQDNIYQNIAKNLKGFNRFLIHGVTGSGKTLLYLKLAKKKIEAGESVLYLVPEINLTPQFLKILKKHFNVPVGIYHSKQKRRMSYWLKNNSPCILLSTRSGVFIPFEKLGLIILDEEHESSYKQEDHCAYHCRDVAIKKAQIADCPIVMGSATPSVNTYYYFKHFNSDHYFSLKERALNASIPKVQIIDLRENEYLTYPFTKIEIHELKRCFENKQQAIIYINRLGYASYLMCSSCGHQFGCKNCSTVMRYYSARNILKCSHCAQSEKVPPSCPECQCLQIKCRGIGTEKVCEILEKMFPDESILRVDRECMTKKKDFEKAINDFESGEHSVLVGTQMISKGHDFSNVGLVVVLGIDNLLNYPDFKANERVYQSLLQVAGRSGRQGGEGRVCLQTRNSSLPVFNEETLIELEAFYQQEIAFRKEFDLYPFKKLLAFYILGKDAQEVSQFSNALSCEGQRLSNHYEKFEVTESRPMLLERRKGYFGQCFLVSSKEVNVLHNVAHTLIKNVKIPARIKVKMDVDPIQLY